MQLWTRYTSFSAIFITVAASLTAALTIDPMTANFSTQPSSWLRNLTPLPNNFTQEINGNNRSQRLRAAGCYTHQQPGQAYVDPQDATIALGRLSSVHDFYEIKTYNRLEVLQIWKTTFISLIKGRPGQDEFSVYDIVTQALHIISYCVYEQPSGSRLGGAIEVGTGDKFLVVVRGVFRSAQAQE